MITLIKFRENVFFFCIPTLPFLELFHFQVSSPNSPFQPFFQDVLPRHSRLCKWVVVLGGGLWFGRVYQLWSITFLKEFIYRFVCSQSIFPLIINECFQEELDFSHLNVFKVYNDDISKVRQTFQSVFCSQFHLSFFCR